MQTHCTVGIQSILTSIINAASMVINCHRHADAEETQVVQFFAGVCFGTYDTVEKV